MRRLLATRVDEQNQPLIPPNVVSRSPRTRIYSQSSLDPNEDPVTGLARVSSLNSIQTIARRNERRRWEQERTVQRHVSVIDDDHILSEKFESLDYEIIENELYRDEESHKDHQHKLFLQSVNRWVVCFLIGIVTALVAAFIDIMVYYSAELKFHVIIHKLVEKCDHDKIKGGGCIWMVLSAWTLYNCCLVGIAAFLVVYFAPASAGSGIPQIKCFLNGIQIPGVVRLKTLISKAIGVSCAVGGGLAAGKEGPMIHSGAVVAAGISQGRCITFPMDFKIFEYFRNDKEKRDFVSAGAAAGNNSFNIWEIPAFCIIAVIGGLLGALFNYLNVRITKYRKFYVRTNFQKIFECLLVAATSAFVGFITIFVVDDCKPIGVNPNLTEVTKLWCPKGQYSAVASLFFQNPEESVKSLFHSPINSFRPMTLFIFAIEYFLLSLWTFGLNVPSGVFIPTLLTGAAWGRLFGIGVEYLFPDVTGIDTGKYALAGAAAQLGGVVRMTISLTAIIVEATKDITFGMPIMLVLMITKFVGDLFNEGLYDLHIELSEIPFLGWHPPKLSRNILAKTIMRKDVIALEPIENVQRLVEIIKTTRHHGFPVVDVITAPHSSQGILLRSHIIVLLKNRHFTKDYHGKIPADGAQNVTLSDFRSDYPRNESNIPNLNLTADDMKCFVNLKPFWHPSPHRVPLNASLNSVFVSFRGLGLRYMLVVDEQNRLRGIITRKDIARFKERRVKNQYLVNEVYISHFDN
uniref:Chloride channel protein n=1 Tax=Panagrolaimus sp. PS1159 TaxID=55785 RepID=A0AC35G446_9BILA